MALFAHLNLESKVQIKDMTRFDGVRSFVSKGSNPITSMTIKAGSDGSAVSVFNSDEKNRYLDWKFTSFSIDIDSSNNKLDFAEGGSELTATLDSGTYTLSTLAAEIQTQMRATGALTYSVSASTADKITISASDGSFSLYPSTGTNYLTSILPVLQIKPKPGFGDSEYSGITTITGKRVRSLPRAVTLTIGDGATTDAVTEYIQVASVLGDGLFSSDKDLVSHRYDILDYLPAGRNSFLHIHRRAQDLILASLDEAGYIDVYGDPLTLAAVTDAEEVRQWSTFMALRLIHDELSNSVDDDFHQKARMYESQENLHKNRSVLRLDLDGDGKADLGEGIGLVGGVVVRR